MTAHFALHGWWRTY
ncbi:trp operon leader peptide [Enterobacter hormaechei]|uniref:trp operon leader peptide n=1 Tax=Enterobacter intestinihominis TaxID=3133180 RepID=A0ABV1ZAB6_9ENTR|nr:MULTISPECIES: trp operon leader peptide [Enterobacter]QLU74416.1 trp operon leader peptide [Enterobacter cloacae]QLU94578.1 trp operon leader peptide [Enterobacter roggenkampii]HCJ6303616.1 trp operon leader peptide [Enterobacter hormaechei subsp. xiangfangensis]MBJ6479027.1 trp operon leader peptide [Enterobacter hormaechei]MBJ6505522.1 trp operon leader peptide [Enterobacter hormaechei]